MLNSPLAKKCAVAMLGASVASVSSNALAFEGVLETPAMPSEKASDYLLVDIENVGSRLVAVGARGHILYSDDRGANWVQASVPVSVLLTAVDFVSADKGWAVGHGGVVLHSNDGGINWVKQFDGNKANESNIEQARAYIAELEFELDEVGGEDSDLEYAIEDAEYALEDAQLDAEVGAAKPLLDVMFLDDKTGFVVGAYGFLFKTEDGGLTWANYGNRLDNLDRFHLNTIAELEGGALLIGGEAGILFSSSDQGESWETLDSPYDGSFFGLVPLEGRGQALAFGLRGNLFRTENAGESWEQLSSNTESTLMSGAFDGNRKVSIAGNGGVVVLSEDGGKTFSAYSREERLGHTALTYITRQRVALVGESGVELVTPSGKNL
ncbi:photosystem I reaction center subunit IV [Oleiphilus sp. HI0071]|nr:photosystem I reaction center subunit IV [Oleiphilus sp. HI0065]KZY84308.1 photosystem I reaction center subunit IV [Oleiphilus sp. HI0071]KZZ02410.1 photosystem I reaction center subunit IV [Oleiphilus sp. HI0073]KZZ50286.1 photosystem I reaction center subunit IV [Oleiphilus sp. HI0122]KZZ78069.1 photosystem I reaction center subunit IV [Oleiphilus sp. HI0130]